MMNDNIMTSVASVQQFLKGSATSPAIALLNNVMAETIGMSMHNAVTAQHNAQLLGSATTTSTCTRILSVVGPGKIPPPPVAPPGPAPVVAPVTPPVDPPPASAPVVAPVNPPVDPPPTSPAVSPVTPRADPPVTGPVVSKVTPSADPAGGNT